MVLRGRKGQVAGSLVFVLVPVLATSTFGQGVEVSDVGPGEHRVTGSDPRGAPLVEEVLPVRGGEAWAEILSPSAARTGGFLTVEPRMGGTK